MNWQGGQDPCQIRKSNLVRSRPPDGCCYCGGGSFVLYIYICWFAIPKKRPQGLGVKHRMKFDWAGEMFVWHCVTGRVCLFEAVLAVGLSVTPTSRINVTSLLPGYIPMNLTNAELMDLQFYILTLLSLFLFPLHHTCTNEKQSWPNSLYLKSLK